MTLASRKRRWLIGLLAIVGVMLLAWLCGLCESIAREMSQRALSRRDYDTASAWAERAARFNEQDFETKILLARLARKRGQIDAMSTLLRRAVTLGLNRDRARREEALALAQTGTLPNLEKRLPQMLMEQQGDGREICEAFTNGFLVHGRVAEATSLIQQWQQAYPQDSLPDVMLGRVSEFDRLPAEAERHYRQALRKNSADLKAAYGLGRVLMNLNRISDAADEFRRGLAQPKRAPFQFGLGRCLILLGCEDEAAEHLRSAAAVPRDVFRQTFHEAGEATEFDEISLELGGLEVSRERYDEAIHWLQRALDYNPLHRQARYQLATALRVSGRMAEAKPHLDFYAKFQGKLSEFDRLHDEVAANPNDSEARYRLGVLCLEMDSAEAGLFWLRSVLSMKPDHPQAHAALAAHFQQLATSKPEYQPIANDHHRRAAANAAASE